MPHTHPLYQPYFIGPFTGRYRASSAEPAPLDEALDKARRMTASGWCGTYTVQPVPSTEPRYTLRVSGPNGLGATGSWPHCVAQPWSEVCAAWYSKAELNAGFHNTAWPLTYRVVAA